MNFIGIQFFLKDINSEQRSMGDMLGWVVEKYKIGSLPRWLNPQR